MRNNHVMPIIWPRLSVTYRKLKRNRFLSDSIFHAAVNIIRFGYQGPDLIKYSPVIFWFYLQNSARFCQFSPNFLKKIPLDRGLLKLARYCENLMGILSNYCINKDEKWNKKGKQISKVDVKNRLFFTIPIYNGK